MLVYIDGKFVPEEEAKVSIFDHGFLYGDGVFEGIRAYNGRVFRLQEHIDRLFDSAKAIDLNPGITKDEMAEIIKETLRKNAHQVYQKYLLLESTNLQQEILLWNTSE